MQTQGIIVYIVSLLDMQIQEKIIYTKLFLNQALVQNISSPDF